MNQPNRPSGQRPSRPREVTQQPHISYRHRKAPAVAGTLIYAVLFLLVILVCMMVIIQSRREERAAAEALDTRYVSFTDAVLPDTDRDPITPSTPDKPAQTAAPVTNDDPNFIGPPSTIPKAPREDITVANTQIAVGNLILVNYEHPYVFPESQPQTVLYGNRAKGKDGKSLYMLNLANISLNTTLFPIFDGMLADFANTTGCREVLITSGYRTYADQEKIFTDRVASQGEEMARLYVAMPGYSEHHAGLAVDMVIYTGGQQYYFPDYEQAAWIVQNAPAYGFILRYTEANQAITHCAPEPWHYRYVGTPHAALITSMGISFEEYHDYLRTFTWDGVRLLIAEDGSVSETDGFDLPASGHMVYYVPALEGESTPVPVPPDMAYEISGNNSDGFIVTVDLKS